VGPYQERWVRNTANNNGDPTDGTTDGFCINGDNNVLKNNWASGNGNDGYEITGAGNTLTNNLADSNSEDGFELNGGFGGNLLKKISLTGTITTGSG
jgi:parallel beta-helix repeat protein